MKDGEQILHKSELPKENLFSRKFGEEHLRVVAPTWPLQNSVAVNPFWNQIDRPFDEVMARMAYLVHHSLYMPVSYYLEKYKNGEIIDDDIKEAANSGDKTASTESFNLEKFLLASGQEEIVNEEFNCFSDFLDKRTGSKWHTFVTYEIAKYASSFFDEGQALAKFPWRGLSFYEAWFEAQEFDKSFQKAGIKGFQSLIENFKTMKPEVAIQEIVSRLRLADDEMTALYVARLSVTNGGWASQFRLQEWRAQFGYSTKSNARSIELTAVQMIIDYAIAESFEKTDPGSKSAWIRSLISNTGKNSFSAEPLEANQVWQRALERVRQREAAAQIKPCEELTALPKIQIAMCIDVRSETYRRAIEATSDEIETIGFAGFFGMPFEYKKLDEKSPEALAPVLLRCGFTVQEEMFDQTATQMISSALARSYFRNLRKAPMSSFLFVELFSLPALSKLVVNLFRSLKFSASKGLPKKFSDRKTRPSQNSMTLLNTANMTLDAKVKSAATVLTHMGLKNRFARLVVFAGHGSQNSNNAFNSASDCGACGGHSGDVNARFFADLLNDPAVRIGLKSHSIEIPSTTHFLAAVHETVTDQLYLLDLARASGLHEEELHLLSSAIVKAGMAARKERQFARSTSLDTSPWRRARNWSEIRPEWALAGNSSFIIAPRRFTKNGNFAGRSFLHDYDWRKDRNFETLELIMTAPMVVTNWINIQYYASTVAPQIYGSGNKVLHNLVNETGVVEGNGGDLRIGLPWQSVHDGTQFVHEPIRLTVFIAAPIDEIERVLEKHASVKNLVVNEWLYICQIDEESGGMRRREGNGVYARTDPLF